MLHDRSLEPSSCLLVVSRKGTDLTLPSSPCLSAVTQLIDIDIGWGWRGASLDLPVSDCDAGSVCESVLEGSED